MQLVGVSTPVAGTAEVHEMKMDGDVMRMRAISKLDLPAGQTVELKPGGYHVMLMDLKQPLAPGSTVPLTLALRDAKGVESKLELKVPVAAAPARRAQALKSFIVQERAHGVSCQSRQPHRSAAMSDNDNFGFGKLVPGFDFLQNIAKGAQSADAQPVQLGCADAERRRNWKSASANSRPCISGWTRIPRRWARPSRPWRCRR